MKNTITRGTNTLFSKSMATMHRWKYSSLAAATLASMALYAPNALALALGPVTVQSALGEPLRAEIDLPSITPAEAESLKVAPAAPETFKAQGMEYSGTASQIKITLENRPGGRATLRLSSSRPVNEPFVDLVINATWAAGSITRSYTMLFDPPALRRATPSVNVAPQLSAPAASVSRPIASPRPSSSVSAEVRPTPSAAPVSNGSGSVTVKAGDTAGRIANANRSGDVSLDQMLVAMLRANPEAFIGGNVNRVKAGAVLQLPSAADANAIPAAEARRTVAAQSRDFNQFRRTLASAAPKAVTAEASRSAAGQVQTQVQEQNTASTSPDKLTLSKGAVKGTAATPEALAERKQANEASARVEELSKNIDELNKLAAADSSVTAIVPAGSAPAAGGTPSPTAGQSATGVTVPGSSVIAPTTGDTPAPSVADTNSTLGDASTATAPATDGSTSVTPEPSAELTTEPGATAGGETGSAPVAEPVAASAPPAAAVEEPSLIDKAMEEPLIPAAVLLLLILLAYGGYRYAQNRRNADGVDSSFMESRLQPDSFFGASGGQRVDTAGNDTTTGSSMAFSPSQLDAGGDVDPVAEADVYLAYGRDLQAEEILKEAVRHNPDRLSVHAKLADIYAKRQDRKALEVEAKDILRLTNGEGTEWARVCELGQEVDPENRYYQPGGQLLEAPEFTAPSSFASTFGGADDGNSIPADLDLDLDLDLPDDALTEAPPAPSSPANAGLAAAALAAATPPAISSATPASDEPPAWTPPNGSFTGQGADVDALDFPMDLPSLDTEPQGLDSGSPAPFIPANSGLMDFDMGSVSLDLDPAVRASIDGEVPDTAAAALPEDPLATKLALAHEFNTIGDNDGARTLIEEVVAESSGDLKARAQRMLKELN